MLCALCSCSSVEFAVGYEHQWLDAANRAIRDERGPQVLILQARGELSPASALVLADHFISIINKHAPTLARLWIENLPHPFKHVQLCVAIGNAPILHALTVHVGHLDMDDGYALNQILDARSATLTELDIACPTHENLRLSALTNVAHLKRLALCAFMVGDELTVSTIPDIVALVARAPSLNVLDIACDDDEWDPILVSVISLRLACIASGNPSYGDVHSAIASVPANLASIVATPAVPKVIVGTYVVKSEAEMNAVRGCLALNRTIGIFQHFNKVEIKLAVRP